MALFCVAVRRGNYPDVYSFDGIYVVQFRFEKMFLPFELPFSFFFFFDLILFDIVCFQYSLALIIFLLFKNSASFLVWQFNSFHCLSSFTFHYPYVTFFYAKFHDYILLLLVNVSN